jgi:DNA cross-link repair 1C protein
MGLYRSLTQTPGNRGVNEAPALCGFELGNRDVTGCLSNDESSRVHSCEPGVSCSVVRGTKTVYIVPIVNRASGGAEVPEVGAGGGIGDLYQTHELELPNESALAELEKLCLQHVHDKEALSQVRTALLQAFQSRKKALSLDTYGVKEEVEISLKSLVTALGHGPFQTSGESSNSDLPNTIVSIPILFLNRSSNIF